MHCIRIIYIPHSLLHHSQVLQPCNLNELIIRMEGFALACRTDATSRACGRMHKSTGAGPSCGDVARSTQGVRFAKFQCGGSAFS